MTNITCYNSNDDILDCSCTWIDDQTGNAAIISFTQPLPRNSTGKIYLSVNGNKKITIGVLIDSVNEWQAIVILITAFIIGSIPVIFFIGKWRLEWLTVKEVQKVALQYQKLEQANVQTKPNNNPTQYKIPGF